LRDELTFQVERHIGEVLQAQLARPKLSKRSYFSNYSVFTH
jgi:hypothetical protein